MKFLNGKDLAIVCEEGESVLSLCLLSSWKQFKETMFYIAVSIPILFVRPTYRNGDMKHLMARRAAPACTHFYHK